MARTQRGHCQLLFTLRVAIDRFFLIPDPKQRRIENEEVPVPEEIGKKLQEK
jgi:hypothetical protein